jgi:hypothetical protein
LHDCATRRGFPTPGFAYEGERLAPDQVETDVRNRMDFATATSWELDAKVAHGEQYVFFGLVIFALPGVGHGVVLSVPEAVPRAETLTTVSAGVTGNFRLSEDADVIGKKQANRRKASSSVSRGVSLIQRAWAF